MTLVFGVTRLCGYCKGSGRPTVPADSTCRHCSGSGFEPGTPPATARRTDPSTSVAAAASVTGIRHSQKVILDLLIEVGPLSDEAIYRFHRVTRLMSPSGARSRRAELVARGLVVDTGRTEKTASGRNSTVWAANGTVFDLVESASDRGKRSPIEYSAQRGPHSVLTSPVGAASHLGGKTR